MAGNPQARAALDHVAPKSHPALQNFVAAMTDVVKNTGKKSIFGKDKGAAAYEAFLRSLLQVIRAMLLDGQIKKNSSSEESLQRLITLMEIFQGGYPNWPEAYTYFTWLIYDNKARTLHLIEMAKEAA